MAKKLRFEKKPTVFTWLNATAFTTLVTSKINVETVQIQPLLISHRLCLCPYFYNQLEAYLHMITI